jgi:plastocyanin
VGGKRLRKLAILAAMLATAMLVVAPALAQGNATTEVVTMQGLEYTPSEITVAPGTTVRWVNQDQADHTVTSDEPGGPLDSGVLGEGQSFEYTFETPGTFTYFCEIHPFMTASVTVSSDGGASTGGDASGGSATASASASASASAMSSASASAMMEEETMEDEMMSSASASAMSSMSASASAEQLADTGGVSPALLAVIPALLLVGSGIFVSRIVRRD